MKLQTERHPKLKELETEAGRFCFEMWRSPQIGRLLVLTGSNGTSKTHVAKAVAAWLTKNGPAKKWIKNPDEIAYLDFIFWQWPRLVDTLKGGNWDVIEDTFTTACLILDDVGAGHDPSRVGVDKLCQILSNRENRWTLITTNVRPADWRHVFDQRISSRFFRNSTLIDLSDVPDYATA